MRFKTLFEQTFNFPNLTTHSHRSELPQVGPIFSPKGPVWSYSPVSSIMEFIKQVFSLDQTRRSSREAASSMMKKSRGKSSKNCKGLATTSTEPQEQKSQCPSKPSESLCDKFKDCTWGERYQLVMLSKLMLADLVFFNRTRKLWSLISITPLSSPAKISPKLTNTHISL